MSGVSIWINGRRESPDGRHVSARDRGLTLADGVFETMRAHGRNVFRLDRHFARLSGALRTLRIPEPPELRQWLAAALAAADYRDARVRLTVTRGAGPPGLAPPDDVYPTVVITVGEAAPVSPAIDAAGLSATIASGRRNEFSMTAGLKTLAFVDNVAALLEARQRGADDALFLDVEGHCSEATASNLFICTGGTLLTAPLSCGPLPGITRATMLELAQSIGVRTVEQPFVPEQLLRADEAFLTNSLRAVAPLVRVGDAPIGAGAAGPLTRRFAAAYAELFARECGASIGA